MMQTRFVTAEAPPVARLLDGMAAAITEKGYAATTIADVVARARVSKRTFYEHFADKEACFLALYTAAAEHSLAVIAQAAAAEEGRPWRDAIEAGVRAYLAELASEPALTRTLLMEIQAAGPRALALRRAVLQRFADQLRDLVEEGRAERPEVRSLSPALSTALVGGVNELTMLAVEEGRAHELEDIADVAAELILAVLAPRS